MLGLGSGSGLGLGSRSGSGSGLGSGEGSTYAVILPLLATQLLWINLVTDLGPALALGVDPPVGDLMARKPRPLTERLIDARMWRDVFEIGLVTAVPAPLTLEQWGVCLAMGSGVLWFTELRKVLSRAFKASASAAEARSQSPTKN